MHGGEYTQVCTLLSYVRKELLCRQDSDEFGFCLFCTHPPTHGVMTTEGRDIANNGGVLLLLVLLFLAGITRRSIVHQIAFFPVSARPRARKVAKLCRLS